MSCVITCRFTAATRSVHRRVFVCCQVKPPLLEGDDVPSLQFDPNKGEWVRVGRPAIVVVHDCSVPQPDPSTAPHTEMVVQLTLSSKAHPDDVAAVIERLQAAIKDAAAATGGRIDIQFALPEIIR
jgi:hypothetical protein